ncbi:MAG: hypothetical protein Q4P20_09830, partial [Eubacteriales bacterium]|nr:hypothetical protein [Eubacteriales bacterium]
DYHDNFSPEEDMVETVALELRCGYAHRYIPFLKDIIDEECEESPRAEELLDRLKINKEIIAKQQGKDGKEKGIELA